MIKTKKIIDELHGNVERNIYVKYKEFYGKKGIIFNEEHIEKNLDTIIWILRTWFEITPKSNCLWRIHVLGETDNQLYRVNIHKDNIEDIEFTFEIMKNFVKIE